MSLGRQLHPALAALLFVLSAARCASIGSFETVRRDSAESGASSERVDAVKDKDFALALAYDDALLAFGGTDNDGLRQERKLHFAQWLDSELAKLGPLTDGNAEAIFGTLVAFHREARRGANADTTQAQRLSDLALVDAEQIMPQLSIVAARVWSKVDKAAQDGELSRAIALAQGIVDELGPDNNFAPRLGQLKAKIAGIHLALAQQAGERLPGARVLHALLAAIYGAKPGELAEPGAALLAETGQNWLIVSPGSCGDSVNRPVSSNDSMQNNQHYYHQAAMVSLATRLASQGFAAGPGQPLRLTVTFDSCPVTKRDWQSEEQVAFKVKQHYEDTVWTSNQPRTSPGANCNT